jgi:hypothetical protein
MPHKQNASGIGAIGIDRTGIYKALAVTSLLALQGALLVYGAAVHSPTVDEPAHLAAGIRHWKCGDFELYKVNAPLVKMLAALPVLAASPNTDGSDYIQGVGVRAEWRVGDDFIRANGSRLYWLVMLARCAVVPLVFLGGYVCWRWARELYGVPAGLVALALWCFCPNILAYGQIITADAGATALGIAAGYAFWSWLKEPSWTRAFLGGCALGLAELSKTTWLVLFLLWPLLALGWGLSVWTSALGLFGSDGSVRQRTPCDRQATVRPGVRGVAQLSGVLLIALLLINLGYGFEGTGARLRDFTFVSRLFSGDHPSGDISGRGNRFAATWLGGLRVPLPKNYVEGIDLQRLDFETGKPSYLRGKWKDRGWWYWYLYALTVKVPLGTLSLVLLATAFRVVRLARTSRRAIAAESSTVGMVTWRDEVILLAPFLVVLALVSAQTGFSRYIRYVLPIFPYAFIWASSVFRDLRWSSFVRWAPPTKATTHPSESGTHGSDSQGPVFESGVQCPPQCPPYLSGVRSNRRATRRSVVQVVALAALGWSVGSSLWYFPHSMSYFNELAGGPLGGPAHLIDAQVEWGQDLLILKNWLECHAEVHQPGLVYFGPASPALAGIVFTVPPKGDVDTDNLTEIARVPTGLEPGWYAISVNFLYGYPYLIRDEKGGGEWATRAYYSYFRRFPPTARAGYGIYIYHLDDHAIKQAGFATSP